MDTIIKQFKYKWRNPITGKLESTNKLESNNEENNLKENVLKGKIIKAGIQAPPGTKFAISLNGESVPFEVIIGKNGILELEYDDIIINKIEIILQEQYIRDQAAEVLQQNEAVTNINAAIKTYQSSEENKTLAQVEKLANVVAQEYIRFYEAVQGIYIEPIEEKQIENIIIDYIAIKEEAEA